MFSQLLSTKEKSVPTRECIRLGGTMNEVVKMDGTGFVSGGQKEARQAEGIVIAGLSYHTEHAKQKRTVCLSFTGRAET